MATLNLPAWGYGLRYRYGLFKQRIAKDGQEETAEDWLEVRRTSMTLSSEKVFYISYFVTDTLNLCRNLVRGK